MVDKLRAAALDGGMVFVVVVGAKNRNKNKPKNEWFLLWKGSNIENKLGKGKSMKNTHSAAAAATQTLFSSDRRRTSNIISTQLQTIAATDPTINNKNTPSTFAISNASAPLSSPPSYYAVITVCLYLNKI